MKMYVGDLFYKDLLHKAIESLGQAMKVRQL